MEQTNWFFHYLEVQLLTTFSPSLETFHEEATGNASEENSFSQYNQGNRFQYLKHDVTKV